MMSLFMTSAKLDGMAAAARLRVIGERSCGRGVCGIDDRKRKAVESLAAAVGQTPVEGEGSAANPGGGEAPAPPHFLLWRDLGQRHQGVSRLHERSHAFKLACRDYPHPRHLCARFPFSSTPHENYCEMCHCYVCDSPAPCIYWSNGHCHSTDKQGSWKTLRTAFKLRNKAGPHPQKPPDITLSMTPPLQNTVCTCRRHPISLPIMPSRPSTLRPCSWTQVRDKPETAIAPHYLLVPWPKAW